MSLLKELNTFSNALVHEWFSEHNSDLFKLKASNEYMSIGRAIDSINFNITGLFWLLHNFPNIVFEAL